MKKSAACHRRSLTIAGRIAAAGAMLLMLVVSPSVGAAAPGVAPPPSGAPDLMPAPTVTTIAVATDASAPDAGGFDPSRFESSELDALLIELATASFGRKRRLVQELGAVDSPAARRTLSALLAGDLYYTTNVPVGVYVVAAANDGFFLTGAASGETTMAENIRHLKRVRTNNQLRKQLRPVVASFDLRDPDSDVRLAAVREMRSTLDDDTAELLRERLKGEPNGGVRRALKAALALHDLDSTDARVRLGALEALSGELGSDIYNRTKRLLDRDTDGNPVEPDAEVRAQAARTVAAIDGRRDVFRMLETLFFGLSLGSVLVLAAIGLAITFGVMGVINMAHGELIMIGAYTSYVVQLLLPNHLGIAVIVAIPAAFIVSGLVGIAIERGVVRFLYGRPLETLLATFGVSLVLQQVVRSIFSPLNRQVATPEWLSGLLRINEAFAITYNRLYVLVFMLLVFGLLLLVMQRTSLGLKVRAVSQNRAMARAMGVRSDRIDALTFGLGSGIAGIAGVALSLLTNVGPNMGQAYIIDSFMVVVFGGVGNLWGTLIGGMTLGVVNKLIEPSVGAVMAKIVILIFIILFIQKRKQGLFPPKGRSAEGH